MSVLSKRSLCRRMAFSALTLLFSVGLLLAGVFVRAGRLSLERWVEIFFYVTAATVFFLWLWSLYVFFHNAGAREEGKRTVLQRILYPEFLLEKSKAQKIAYIGVSVALCTAVNLFEIKFVDVQFSFTVFASILTGILIGPLFGFVAAFLGDGVGFLGNPAGYLYMPWVGLSVACMALIAGLVMKIPFHFKGSGYLKLALICLLTLFLCSVGINTTGMYFYYTRIGFSSKALNLIQEHFGGANTYLAYALVRLLFMGQIWNSVVNFALLFAALPLLNAAKPFKIQIK